MASSDGVIVQGKVSPPTFLEFLENTLSFQLHSWQSEYLVPLLESLVEKRGQRILVHAPPQFGKSILCSKRFPAWALGTDPHRRIILAGYNVTHSTTQFAEPVRDLMLSAEFAEMFKDSDCRIPARCSAEGFSTAARRNLKDGQDSLTAVGLLSGFTGKGLGPGDILIIDDPYASPDDARSAAVNERVWRWWTELVSVRVHPEANVLVMYHRYHDDDFGGRLLRLGGWTSNRFAAIRDENEDGSDPTRRAIGTPLSEIRPLADLLAVKASDPLLFAGQFQGRPRPPEGRFFKTTDFQVRGPWEMPEIDRWVRAWDLATSVKEQADFTAGALIGVDSNLDIWIRDIVRVKMEFPDARRMIISTAQIDGPSVAIGVEGKVAGLAMVQDLVRVPELLGYQIQDLPAKGDKKQRAQGWAARARLGHLFLVRGDWTRDFINEALAFDGLGLVHDDQIDAVSAGFALVSILKGGTNEKETLPKAGTPLYYERLAEGLVEE